MKKIGVALSLISLAALGLYVSGNVRIPGLRETKVIGPYYIVVERDTYGVPFRCAKYTQSITLRLNMSGGTASYVLSEGVSIYHASPAMTVVELDQLTPFAEEVAYEALGLTAESCERVHERRYDPDSDQYLAPGELESDRAIKENDREPRGLPPDAADKPDPSGGSHRDPMIDLPPDAQGL